MSKKWTGVDLDGTLAQYGHFRGYDNIGDPILKMVERVKKWLSEGKDVRIMTARVAEGYEPVPYIEEWCLKHIGAILPVTCCKDYDMEALWDDRAVRVIKNTGEVYGGEEGL